MEEVYSALLLHSAGKPINEENLKKVLEAAGAKIDEGKIKALIASLEGQNIDELIKQAATMPVVEKKAEEKEEKKAEEKEEKKAEEAAAGLSALFG